MVSDLDLRYLKKDEFEENLASGFDLDLNSLTGFGFAKDDGFAHHC